MLRKGDRVKVHEKHRSCYGTIRTGQWVDILDVDGPANNYCTIRAVSSGLIIYGAILGGY